jgi:predicted dehydrogenase
MSDIRIGLVGFGGMSSAHARGIAGGSVPGAKLGAICDPFPAAQERARAAYPDIPVFEKPEDMYASGKVDGVMVCTPHFSHPPLAISAFEHNLHVLIEKPAGVFTKQVKEMNDAAATKPNLVFGIMFNQRTDGHHAKMRELVANGELGELKRTQYVITDWYRTQAYYQSGGWRATWGGEGGGVLLNQAPHNLDLWQWICGMPTRVRAFCGFGKYHDIEVEDDVTAYVEYANGATGVFITSTGECPGSNSFEVIGDRGKLVLEGSKLTFYRTVGSVQADIYASKEGFTRVETWKCEVPTHKGEGHTGIVKNWVAAIKDGTPLLAPGAEGINGVALSNAMLLSAWTDGWVNLPIDDDLYYQKLREKVDASDRFKADW